MNIWLNKGFSLFEPIRILSNIRDLEVLHSHTDPLAPSRLAATKFIQEPADAGEAYAAWAHDTARKFRVQHFVPQRGRKAIIAMKADFEAIGTQIHVPASWDVLDHLDDKAAFALDRPEAGLTPHTIHVTSADQLLPAIEAVRLTGREACVKPVRGIFGNGYWMLKDGLLFNQMQNPDNRVIDTMTYVQAVERAAVEGKTISLLVMEFLPLQEASVDVLCMNGETHIAVARIKETPSRQNVTTHHKLIDLACDVVKFYGLSSLVNVQFKMAADGAWKLLEINPRLSGGVSYVEAAGIPILQQWVELITGKRSRADHFDVSEMVYPLTTAWTMRGARA